jgi:hypothetical protein
MEKRGGGGRSLPRSLADECLAPQMVQQLNGAPPEGTRNVQERQYRVPFQYFAWKEYHVPDVLPDGDCQDRVDKLSGQQQCRVLGCSRLGRVLGCWSGRDYCCATATPSPFPRYDGCRHKASEAGRRIRGPRYSDGRWREVRAEEHTKTKT